MLDSLSGQNGSKIRSLWELRTERRTLSCISHSHPLPPPHSISWIPSRHFLKIVVRGHPLCGWRTFAPWPHGMNVANVLHERTSPPCPPKLSGINQNARILQRRWLQMRRYGKCFQFAFSQITSFALKGKLVFFDYDDARQLLTAHLGEQGEKPVELGRGGRNASDFDDKNHQRISFPWILTRSFRVLFNAAHLNIEIISNASLSFWKFLPWEWSQLADGWGTLIGSSPLFVINSADELHKWKYIFIMQIIPRLHSNGPVGYFITFTLRTC